MNLFGPIFKHNYKKIYSIWVLAIGIPWLIYSLSIEPIDDAKNDIRVEQCNDYYCVEIYWWDSDEGNYYWDTYEQYETLAEARAVYDVLVRRIEAGVWYDFFYIGKLSKEYRPYLTFIPLLVLWFFWWYKMRCFKALWKK